MVEVFNDEAEAQVIASRLSKDDFHHALSLRTSPSNRGGMVDQLSLADFMKVKLLQLGVCDRDTLIKIENQFHAIDVDKSGFVSMAEVETAAAKEAEKKAMKKMKSKDRKTASK